MLKLIQLRRCLEVSKPFVSIGNQQLIDGVTKRFYANDNGNQNANIETNIEPVSLSYNSYENTNVTSTAAPIIIMHGEQ